MRNSGPGMDVTYTVRCGQAVDKKRTENDAIASDQPGARVGGGAQGQAGGEARQT